MRANIVQIGNSKGVRIPKALIEQLKFEMTVEFEILPEGLFLRPIKADSKHPREGWEEAFRLHPPRKSDYPWREVSPTLASDDKEWTW